MSSVRYEFPKYKLTNQLREAGGRAVAEAVEAAGPTSRSCAPIALPSCRPRRRRRSPASRRFRPPSTQRRCSSSTRSRRVRSASARSAARRRRTRPSSASATCSITWASSSAGTSRPSPCMCRPCNCWPPGFAISWARRLSTRFSRAWSTSPAATGRKSPRRPAAEGANGSRKPSAPRQADLQILSGLPSRALSSSAHSRLEKRPRSTAVSR